LVSQAVAELHLGRTEEAQAALDQALKKEPEHAEAIANLLVLSVITGKSAEEATRYVPLRRLAINHPVSNEVPALSKRPMLSTRSWWTWLKRASCLIRRLPSTRPRWRHRCVYDHLRLMISTKNTDGLGIDKPNCGRGLAPREV
jgi:hypothetical protein